MDLVEDFESAGHPISTTLHDPVDYGPPSSSVHGILQARILEGLPHCRQILNHLNHQESPQRVLDTH